MPFDIPILVFTMMKQINIYFEFSLYVKYVLKFCVVDSTWSYTQTRSFMSIKMSNNTDIQSLKQLLLAGIHIRYVCLQFEVDLKSFKCHLKLRSFAWCCRIYFNGQVPVRLDSKQVLWHKTHCDSAKSRSVH